MGGQFFVSSFPSVSCGHSPPSHDAPKPKAGAAPGEFIPFVVKCEYCGAHHRTEIPCPSCGARYRGNKPQEAK